MKKEITIIFLILILACFIPVSYATVYQEKLWGVSTFTGSFSKNNRLKYYLEPQLRLINDPYVFNQALFLAGLGYEITPSLVFFTGPGLVVNKNVSGVLFQEYRLWQQLNWNLLNQQTLLNSRTRFEEKIRSNQPGTGLCVRQRFWLRIPMFFGKNYYYSLFDEAFFHLNHPIWSSNNFLYQNRAFIGIAKRIHKNTFIDVGYLNQLQLNSTNTMSNVLLVSFMINF